MKRRTLQLDAQCPRCGDRPALRVFKDEVHRLKGEPEDKPIGTYRCGRCRHTYIIRADAYQKAS